MEYNTPIRPICATRRASPEVARRLGFVEVAALIIMLGYLAGMALLYGRGIGV